jgi:hypothetical protein
MGDAPPPGDQAMVSTSATGKPAPEALGSRLPLVVTLVIVALAAIAAGLYFSGVIKI